MNAQTLNKAIAALDASQRHAVASLFSNLEKAITERPHDGPNENIAEGGYLEVRPELATLLATISEFTGIDEAAVLFAIIADAWRYEAGLN